MPEATREGTQEGTREGTVEVRVSDGVIAIVARGLVDTRAVGSVRGELDGVGSPRAGLVLLDLTSASLTSPEVARALVSAVRGVCADTGLPADRLHVLTAHSRTTHALRAAGLAQLGHLHELADTPARVRAVSDFRTGV